MHSYRQACSCRIDTKASSSRKRVWCCSTRGNNGLQCEYEVIYRKKQKGASTWFELDRSETHLRHVTGCASVPQLSVKNLIAKDGFRQTVISDKGVGIKNLRRDSLESGIIRSSVSVSRRNLYRAKRKILLHEARDYDDRFNKLHEWGEAFTKANPGSMFSIMRDNGRLVAQKVPIYSASVVCLKLCLMFVHCGQILCLGLCQILCLILCQNIVPWNVPNIVIGIVPCIQVQKTVPGYWKCP